MTVAFNPKLCLTCNKPLKGRTDKKFCDDYCRSSFNNQLNSDNTVLVKLINSVLKKNRRILERVLSGKEDLVKTTRQKLSEKGFSFKYFTHNYINKKGDTYFFVYEFGYLSLDNDWLLIVKRKED